jgi:hypothetical protein
MDLNYKIRTVITFHPIPRFARGKNWKLRNYSIIQITHRLKSHDMTINEAVKTSSTDTSQQKKLHKKL